MAAVLVPMPVYIATSMAERGVVAGVVVGVTMIVGVMAITTLSTIGFARFYRLSAVIPLILGSIPIIAIILLIAWMTSGIPADAD